MLIPSRAYFFCTPAAGLQAEEVVVDHTSVEVVATPTTRLSCTRCMTVSLDQISLFEQQRRVMTRQGALGKRERKKTKLGERRGVRSNLRTYVSYAPVRAAEFAMITFGPFYQHNGCRKPVLKLVNQITKLVGRQNFLSRVEGTQGGKGTPDIDSNVVAKT